MIVHIPKCSGTSFYEDAKKLVARGIRVETNHEQPILNTERHSRVFLMSFLRHPVEHVMSQFLMCKYSFWAVHMATKRFKFPRDNSSILLDGLSEWIGMFTSSNHTLTNLTCNERGDCKNRTGPGPPKQLFDYNCYNPWNMQARYLATRAGHHADVDQLEPDLVTAKLGLQSLTFNGITDLYPESVCAFRFYITGTLPPDCECVQTAPNGSELSHIKHGVPEHHHSDLSPENFRSLSNLIQVDVRVFLHALALFERSIDNISGLTGKRIICSSRLADLKIQALRLCQEVSAQPQLCAF